MHIFKFVIIFEKLFFKQIIKFFFFLELKRVFYKNFNQNE